MSTELVAIHNTEICSILIHGEGGSGKTHLACQIAISCMNRDKNTSLFNHPSIPIIIEDEVSNTDNPQEDVMSAISGQLRQTIASPNKIPYPLLIRLIESRRVLIIVDHFSEMNKSTTVALNKLFETSVINGLIVTSRIEEKLSDSPLVKIIPLRLKKGHLRHFFDAYFRKCGKIELFDDLEFGKLLNRLSKLVGNRDITVLLCKLYADQLIAFKSGQLDNLPKNIPELVLQYLNELNRNITNERLSDMVIHNHAKKIAWLSIKQSFRSSPVSLEEVLNSLGANHQNDIIHYFKDKLHIIKTIEPSKDKIKFVLDPIAEYLAGMHIVENFSQIDWNTLLDRINSSKDELNKAKGFLFALIDCCKADHVESDIPDDVLNALEKHI